MKRMINLLTLIVIPAVVLLGLSTPAFATEHDARLKAGLGFHFLAASVNDDEAVARIVVMTGTGTFNDRQVTGGGFFQESDDWRRPGLGQTLFQNGTWHATRLISFTEIDHPNNPFGFVLSGILDMEVLLFPDGGPPTGIPATLKVACNLAAVGVFTGLSEGIFLDIEGGRSYEAGTFPPTPIPTGFTAFSVGQGPDPGFDTLSTKVDRMQALLNRVALRLSIVP